MIESLRPLRELAQIDALLERLSDHARIETLTIVEHRGHRFPVHGVVLGATDRRLPTLAVVGGVHGLERIGTRVVLAYLHTLVELLGWDDVLARALERSRLVFVPLVNPAGMLLRTRANGAGVDLMRNAPPHPDGKASRSSVDNASPRSSRGSWGSRAPRWSRRRPRSAPSSSANASRRASR